MGSQQGLVSMVYKFFNKKTPDGVVKNELSDLYNKSFFFFNLNYMSNII